MTDTETETPKNLTIPGTYPPVMPPVGSFQPAGDHTLIYALERRQIHRDADDLIGDQVWQVRLVEYHCSNEACFNFRGPVWLGPGVNTWRTPQCPRCKNWGRYNYLVPTGRYRLSLQQSEREVGYRVQCNCTVSQRPGKTETAFKTVNRQVNRKPYRVHLPCSVCHAAPVVTAVITQTPRWVAPGTAEGPYALISAK